MKISAATRPTKPAAIHSIPSMKRSMPFFFGCSCGSRGKDAELNGSPMMALLQVGWQCDRKRLPAGAEAPASREVFSESSLVVGQALLQVTENGGRIVTLGRHLLFPVGLQRRNGLAPLIDLLRGQLDHFMAGRRLHLVAAGMF